MDNDPVFSLNVVTKAIVHIKFLLRFLSKPTPLCENILHQVVAHNLTVNSTRKASVMMMGGPLRSYSILQESKEKSNQSAAYFLTVTNVYITKQCSSSSRSGPQMFTELLLTDEKEENLNQLFINLMLISKLSPTRDKTVIKHMT